MNTRLASLLVALLMLQSAGSQTIEFESKPIPSVKPSGADKYSEGVSAAYAGMLGNELIIAGGCNFPDKPASRGGKKVFYDGIYALHLHSQSKAWRRIGSLPAPAAYGVSIVLPNGIALIGGQNSNHSLTSALLIRRPKDSNEGISIEALPPLPMPIDNMAGALVGRRIYIVGGNIGGQPSNRVFSLCIDSLQNGWREEPLMPGKPRTQAAAVALKHRGEEKLYVFGGFAATGKQGVPSVSTQTLAYSPSTKTWQTASTPTSTESVAITLGGGAACSINDTLALAMGGVNKEIFLEALQRERNLAKAIKDNDSSTIKKLSEEKREYMEMHPKDYRFNTCLLIYNSASDSWSTMGHAGHSARAGAALAKGIGKDSKLFYQLGGETKPGIRTPEAWLYEIKY